MARKAEYVLRFNSQIVRVEFVDAHSLRIFIVHVGIFVACFAAALALVTIEIWTIPIPGEIATVKADEALLVHTVIIGMVGSFFSYVPSVIVGLGAEILRIRSILFYASVGCGLGLLPTFGVLPSWVNVANSGDHLIASPLKAYPAVGVIGGCMYWLIAGYKAGFVKRLPANE